MYQPTRGTPNARVEYSQDVCGTWFFVIDEHGEQLELGPPFGADRAAQRDRIISALGNGVDNDEGRDDG